MNNPLLLGQFDEFVKHLSQKDKIALVHDLDPDGISSGVITAHAVQFLRGKKIDLRIHQKPGEIALTEKTIKLLLQKKITKLITTDKAVEQDLLLLKKAAQICDILIIDHHKIYSTELPSNVLLMKPQILLSPLDPSRYCTAKLAYDLWSRHVNLSPIAWKACPGIIGDIAYVQWKSFVDEQLKKINGKITKDPFHNIFGKMAEMFSQTECYDYRKVGIIFNTLWKAKNPNDVLKSNLKKYSTIVQKEIDYYMRHAKKLAVFYPKKQLIIYEIKPKYNIKSNLSTVLSMIYPNSTLILASLDKQKKNYTLSLRRQDQKIKMNELIEKALIGLQGSGGGHIPAAGGRVARKDFEKFKENVLKLL